MLRMPSRRLYLVNQSTNVSHADCIKMVHAVNRQIRDHASPLWGIDRVVVEFHSGDLATAQESTPKGSWVMALMDHPDQAGVLGWHWLDDKDRIYSEVFTEPCFASGSTALSGTYAVSSVVSHEALETLGDPFCNEWVDTGRGFLVAKELCDAVEADVYEIDGVTVSNFVLPEWFDSTTSAGEKFDYLGRATAPFTMTPGGYWVQMPSAKESQQFKRTVDWETEAGFDVRDQSTIVFSPEMPEWLREMKMLRGRNLIKRLLV